jgi:hypothetical protein
MSLGVATTIWAGAARADEQAEARVLFNEGVALMNEGKVAQACPKFEASLKHFPGMGTRGKLAECYEKVGRFVSAYNIYKEVAQLATRSGDPTREQVANERAKALEPKLSYVTVSVPNFADVPGLVVKRNGHEVERSKFGAADPVDAGQFTFEVTAPGRKPYTGHLTLTAGQAARFDVPQLELESTPPPPPGGARPPSGSNTGGDNYSPPAGSTGNTWQKPLGLGVAALGVIGIGVGSVFGLSASSKYDKAFEPGGGCDKATKECDADGQSAVDDARSKATLSTVFFIVGGTLVVGGAVVFFTAPSASSSPRALHVVPSIGSTGGGITIGGKL